MSLKDKFKLSKPSIFPPLVITVRVATNSSLKLLRLT